MRDTSAFGARGLVSFGSRSDGPSIWAVGNLIVPLPDFIIIGGTKCGSTSLTSYLSNHSDVFLAPKELRFFTEEHRWNLGFDWYQEQFTDSGTAIVSGEASNAYTRDPVYEGASRRIKKAVPDAKLVYIIREPWSRMASHYRHRIVTGREWRSADAALRSEHSYMAATLYGHQLSLYRQSFPKEQIMLLSSEELFRRPEEVLSRLCHFLGVPYRSIPLRRENASTDRRAVAAALRPLARFPVLQPVLRRSSQIVPGPFASDIPFEVSEATRQSLNQRLNEDRQVLIALGAEAAVSWPEFPAGLPHTLPTNVGS